MTDEERKKIFSANLNKFLSINGKSQIDVAKAIDVSQQTFNTWCRGVAIPRMGKIQLLADYFKIDMSELISNATPAAPEPNSDSRKAQLLRYYEKFNEEGKERLLNYAQDLDASGRYKETQASEDAG